MKTGKIMIPSFAVERRTQALSASLWGFVGLISMFTVGLGVFVSHQMLVSVFKLTGTFMSDHMALAGLVPIMGFAALFGVGLYAFIDPLLHAYEIDGEKIVKGRIVQPGKVKGGSLALEAALHAYMAAQVRDGAKVSGAVGIKNLFGVLELIAHNMKQPFADAFFHTDLYKKKEYLHPKLVKETRRCRVYACDGGKTVKIRKIYTGMEESVGKGRKRPSMAGRVVANSVLVLLAFALLSTADLAVGAVKNPENIAIMQQTVSETVSELEAFGYTAEKINEKNYRFEKAVSSERTSYIQYTVNVNGQVERVKFDLYYSAGAADMRAELAYIIAATGEAFGEAEVSAFLENAQKTAEGEAAYDRLEAGDCRVVLGTSGGYAHVHN